MKTIIAPIQRANHGQHFRAYGLRGLASVIDPFINVDHAWMSAPTFPPHPHAGFSAVSYPFLDSETGIANRDSIGSNNLIQPGGLHWATAGRGIVHEEIPAEVGKTLHSLQIFIDLPRERQDVTPFVLGLEPQDVPVVNLPGVKVRVPVGRFGAVLSPLNPPTDVTILDISLEPGAELLIPIAAGHSAFFMPIFGTVEVDGRPFGLDDLKLPVYLAQDTPHEVLLRGSLASSKVMLFSGKPLHSPQPTSTFFSL